MIPRRVAASAILLALVLALVGCAPATPEPPGTWPEDPIEDSRTSSAAPASFRDRPELASCGEVVLEQGESIPDDASACLDAAFTTGAELVVLRPTTEGDPYIEYFRVGPDIEGMEIFSDSTLDRFGFGWAHQLCPDATSLLDFGECVEAD